MNEFALCDIPYLIESVLTFRVLTSVKPNLRNAYKYISRTLMTFYVNSSPPHTRDVRISTKNIFPFK